ncbi:Moulting cycle family protein [Acanthocheilonema viteae]
MNKKTFEIAKNLHLNWYIYAIKALLGQVGKQMYQQLTKDKQKMLASCLDQIEDDRDLVASAKCLVQARRRRYFSTCREDFQQGQASNESSDTPAFITISDSEKKEEVPFKNRDYKKKNMGRHHQTVTREETFHISRSGFENKPSKRHSSSKQFLRFSNILDFNHLKNFTPHNFNAFKHLTDPISVSESSNQQKFRISKETYLNRLLPVDKKSGHLTSMLKKHSTGKNETSETLYLIENEIKRSTNHIGQSPNFSHYQKNGRTEKHSKKPELVKKINLPERSRNFKKSDRYLVVPNNSVLQRGKLYSSSFLPKFSKKKLWQRRRRSYRLITNRAMKSDHLIIDVKRVNKMPAMHDSIVKKTPTQQLSKFISVMVSGKEANGNWTKTYEHIMEFKKQMDQHFGSSNTRVYTLRLFDLVLDNEKRTRPKVQSKYKDLISMIIDFVNGINRNSKNEQLNFRFLSPRVMPLMPDKMQFEKRILSPSIMSFYKDDNPDNIIPFPKLLEKSGMTEEDRKAVLEMIMDVSGARVAIEMAFDILNETNVSNLEGVIFETTKRINQSFKDLEKSFNVEQQNDLERKGFTFLEASQLKQIFHQQGVKKLEDVNFDLKKYEQLNRTEKEETLWTHIERIAENETEELHRRKRQAKLTFKPTILAPFMFSPTFGLSILGPVVLSPSIFSPLILNPSILNPYVLSPGIFLPFLISPYILSPYVLSPLVGAPYILSPYILSPNVINPYVLSPLVLSPYILSPDILSPQALGGQILSPNVFSPSIYTDSVLSVSILSPSWMSK